MLYQIGSVIFRQTPFEVHDVTCESATDYAPKGIMQMMRPREWVGEGDQRYLFLCTLFPTRLGGLTELGQLQAQRQAHVPRGARTPGGQGLRRD